MEITQNWRLAGMNPNQQNPLELAAPSLDDRFWMTAEVPGDVHTALIRRGLIDNPYFGHRGW